MLIEMMGQSKDYMEIFGIEQFCFPGMYPLLPQMSLAFRTMPVATTIIADMDLPALRIIALVNMSAHCCGTATGYGIHRTALPCVRNNLVKIIYMLADQAANFSCPFHRALQAD
jgi:hypothetical protein